MLEAAVSSYIHSVTDALARVLPSLRAAAAGDRLRFSGLKGAAQAFFLSRCLIHVPRSTLYVLPSAEEAEAFADDLRLFLGSEQGAEARVRLYPPWDVPAFEGLSPSSEVLAAQIEGLYALLATTAPVLVTSVDALAQRVMPQEELMTATLQLSAEQELPLSDLVDHLVQWGYRRVPLVEEKGEVSVRGGIVDLFPPLAQQPLRIEFLGDSVESIRVFDPSSQRSQRSVEQLDELTILPMRSFSLARLQAARRTVEEAIAESEVQHREQQRIVENLKSGLPFPGVEFLLPYLYPTLESLVDYLPRGTVVWQAEPLTARAALEKFAGELSDRTAEADAAGRFVPAPERLYLSAVQTWASLASSFTVELEGLEVVDADVTVSTALHTGLKPVPHAKSGEVGLAPLVERLRLWQEEHVRVFLVVSGTLQASHLQSLLLGYDLRLPIAAATNELWQEKVLPSPVIVVGHVSQGFALPADGLVVLSEEDIFGERRHRRRARRQPVIDYLTGLSQLTVGDYVVHVDHGVGLYQGLRHLTVADTEGDYLHLEYASGDRLYLPVERINLVQKYTGAGSQTPALDRLGSVNWEKVKRKTREAIQAMARELLEIHAAREITERPAFAKLDGIYEEFVARFPFEETSGQQAAIDDVLTDLHTDKPMDRLVCGDVGYGKTEVALRAAFLAVESGKQVAVLVPTTVLAQQHGETFTRRFAEYPVRIEVLSRFRSAQEIKTVVPGLANGTVDIVIGTHRLLQRDIVFKNLGLMVIDEEHRFGVADKEKIKKLRHLVDVLTLSATPIPRTLNMALMGMRDLSVIETPPVDRQAIRTYVARFDDGLIRSAILNELGRGGQVFFVHNRVETIERMAKQLRELVPEAALAVAHGQMPERELEKVMLDFLHHRSNVLLCSAIIESGLDIPTANTMIINRADQFGLAQLYQLRGRIGRSSQRAYAYLLIPGEHLLTPDAKKRLEVLQELDDLGSGFRLAAHDLEIRGAGNLLGKEQSGNVTAVGFELYAQMLEETVQELRGGKIRVQIEPDIQIGLPAYIPEAYIPEVNQRLVFYKKLANVQDWSDLEELANEMEDRFGPLPELVRVFLEVMDLRRVLREYLVTSAYKRGDKVTVHFHPDAPIKSERLVVLLQKDKGRSQLSPDLRFTFTLKPGEEVIPAIKALLQTLSESC
ncbi:MAG: transcription-repair coupling factor [Deltaproteobacteria bacterium]|nr:transcription-repair coupling factor [Deltaproteobacteria bacterium]